METPFLIASLFEVATGFRYPPYMSVMRRRS